MRRAVEPFEPRLHRILCEFDLARAQGHKPVVVVHLRLIPLAGDERAADALRQMELADATAFQALLEERSATARLAALAAGALREGSRLAQRAALQRAFAASP